MIRAQGPDRTQVDQTRPTRGWASWSRRTRLALQGAAAALVAVAALVACHSASDTTDAGAAPRNGVASGLKPAELMDAAFGSDQQIIGRKDVYWRAELTLPAPVWARAQDAGLPAAAASQPTAHSASADAGAARAASASLSASGPDAGTAGVVAPPQRMAVRVRPREVVRINEDNAALVLESAPVDAAGELRYGTRTPAYLGVVYFRRVAARPASDADNGAAMIEKWAISRFQPAVDQLGQAGTAGDSQIYKVAPNLYLMTFEPVVCTARVCSQWLQGYRLELAGMGEALRLQLSGSNVQAWPDCHRRLADARGQIPTVIAPPLLQAAMARADEAASAAGAGALSAAASAASAASGAASGAVSGRETPGTADGHTCYALHGEASPISREGASADFSIRYRGMVSPRPGERRRVQQTVLYRLHNGHYALAEGGPGPLPGF